MDRTRFSARQILLRMPVLSLLRQDADHASWCLRGVEQKREEDEEKMKAQINRLSADAKRMIEHEIKKETVKLVRAYEKDLDVAWLYAIRETFDFGAERLKRLYKRYFSLRKEVQDEYLGTEGDGIRETAMKIKLQYAGVDVDKLYDELGGESRLTVAYKNNTETSCKSCHHFPACKMYRTEEQLKSTNCKRFEEA